MTYLQVNILFININIYLLTVQVNMLFAFVCIILFYTFQADKWCEDKGAHLIEIHTQVAGKYRQLKINLTRGTRTHVKKNWYHNLVQYFVVHIIHLKFAIMV